MNELVFIGDWTKDRVLGSGSFGIVVLWRHNRTDEKLAIKTCKWGDELNEKHRERWTKEVEMLQKWNNANIVSTKELPIEFRSGLERVNPSRLPILCMEYCSGGDLRQLLNKADSCSGIKEFQVRQILSDIRNAMQFLHSNKITHRDLKPENVVMQVLDRPGRTNMSQVQEKVVYKLIDLGYAKEIDSNSVCASFVGTLQYLAPELFASKTYSNSVDFWSFGILAFEVICGTRPFLPFLAPVQWIPHVKKKAHDNICVYETFHGDIEYSNELLPENFMSKPFKILLERWLRVALEWDPKLRGRDAPSKVTFNIPSEGTDSAASKIVIFDLLEEILTRKIIKVFSVSTLSQHAYEIDETTKISTLKEWLEKDGNVTIQNQILISPKSFINLGDNELVSSYWNDSCNVMLFLYDKTIVLKENIEPIVPKCVLRSLKENQKALYNFKNSQNLYKNSVYFVMSQIEMYELLINGLYVRAESFKHEGKLLLLKHNKVDKSIGKLVDKRETATNMTDTGKKHIENLRETGTGVNYLGGFDKIFKDVDVHSDKINKLQVAWNQLSVRLQSATRRSNEVLSVDINNFVTKNNFQAIYADTLKTYVAFKKGEFFSDHKTKEKQCTDIIKLCYECLKLRCKILQEMRHQPFVLKLMDLNTEFSKISDIVENAANNTEKLSVDLNNSIAELTDCMWATISMLSSDADDLANLPYSIVSFQKRDFKIGESVSSHCIKVAKQVDDDAKLKSLIEESLKLRKNHTNLSEKLNMQKKMLNPTHFDFSFLKEQ